MPPGESRPVKTHSYANDIKAPVIVKADFSALIAAVALSAQTVAAATKALTKQAVLADSWPPEHCGFMHEENAMAEEALIVIDLQNDFCPGGALAVAGGDEIVPLVNELVQQSEHVILTQDWHPRPSFELCLEPLGQAAF